MFNFGRSRTANAEKAMDGGSDPRNEENDPARANKWGSFTFGDAEADEAESQLAFSSLNEEDEQLFEFGAGESVRIKYDSPGNETTQDRRLAPTNPGQLLTFQTPPIPVPTQSTGTAYGATYGNAPLRSEQLRSEQSRSEQSRYEQSRQEQSRHEPSQGAPRTAPRPTTTQSLNQRFGADIRSALGVGTVIEGRFSFETPTQIDGTLNGEVTSTSVLVIGEHALVRANIKVGTLIVLGKVHGNINATEMLEIKANGHLVGDVVTGQIAIEAGGYFEGNVRQQKQD